MFADRFHGRGFITAILLSTSFLQGCGDEDPSDATPVPPVATLSAGATTLSFPAVDTGYGVRIAGTGMAPVAATQPVRIFVCTNAECPADGSGNQTVEQTAIGRTAYASVTAPDANGVIVATASVASAAGTRFQVEDRYSVAGATAPGAFRLARHVTALSPQGTDRGFTSQFRMAFETAPTSSYHLFSPAVWYDRNVDVPQTWFGGVMEKPSIYWRETRAGLPLVMIQDPATGSALTLAHVGAPPSSGINEGINSWQVDASIRNGALGVQNAAQIAGEPTSIGFIYPANETARTTTASVSWVRRSTPVADNAAQDYTLLLALQPGAIGNGYSDVNAAMSTSWRVAYTALRPTDYRTVPAETVYDASIGLVGDWSRARKGAAQGVPGVVSLPAGPTEKEIAGDNWAYVMGYIGEQIPLGFQLFWRGIDKGNVSLRTKGALTLDFWANTAARPAAGPNDGGITRTDARLPFTWYYVPSGAFDNSTCQFPIYLRYLGDGMEAMVSGAVLGRQKGFAHPSWERFASGFGNWLVDKQNADGSWYRAYNPDGTQYTNTACASVATTGDVLQNTTHVIRFLAQLYKATGDTRYRDAAVKAGNFAAARTFGPGRYVGGTTDTPNILDREGGIIATRAALALFDATGDRSWLKWARQAAIFSETWTYAYNFPIFNAPPQQRNGPIGMSMISTGQSGADISASLLSYDLFRLYLFDPANDDHFRDMARLVESTTKYASQLPGVADQAYGYGHDGLVGEANNWWTMRGNASGTGSAYQWLPWLSNAQLDPLQRMQDRFGAMSVDAAMQRPAADLKARNEAGLPGPFADWGR